MRKWYSLIDKIYKHDNLYDAFRFVKRNKGAAGIDKVSIPLFEDNLATNIHKIHLELKSGVYSPSPVKRVEIPKDKGKTRPLGIPTVKDRIVQQAILNIIQPIFEPDFHPQSYGYRPNKSCHKAVAKARLLAVRDELPFVVDMDLSKCFDTLNHKFIMKILNKKISDGTLLKLIEAILKSGVMQEGKFSKTTIGSPQGGVISPLLMNIYLNEFDQVMKSKGIEIVRYADDILIFAKTKKKAEQYQRFATKYLNSIHLIINEEKTHIATVSNGIKYLGFVIFRKYMIIDKKRLKALKDKIKRMTPRNSGINLSMIIRLINPVLRGWSNYFRVADCKGVFNSIMQWIRRRLRMKKMREWKSWKPLHKQLRRIGYKGKYKRISMVKWRNSCSPLVHKALSNNWFKEIGLYDITSKSTGVLFNYYE
jgi:RNA-directed DNA polymerase